MHDYTLRADVGNHFQNFAARQAKLMSITERWEAGFDQAYFKQGSRLTLGNFQEYVYGWHCGWNAYAKLRDSEGEKLEQWQTQKDLYLSGKAYRVPYQLKPKKRFHLHVSKIEEVEAKRKNPSLNWQVELALSSLNILTHEEGMEFTQAVFEALAIFPEVSEVDLTEAYDAQIVTYIGNDTIEFTYQELSPQAQAESDLVDHLF
jgi:hypothetical protein